MLCQKNNDWTIFYFKASQICAGRGLIVKLSIGTCTKYEYIEMINEEKPSTWYHSFLCFSIKSNFSFHVQFQKEGLLINLPNEVLNNCTKNI